LINLIGHRANCMAHTFDVLLSALAILELDESLLASVAGVECVRSERAVVGGLRYDK
jgi:hypothetical protein